MRCERGQASVEWVGLVLLVALGLAAVVGLAPSSVEGRDLGATLAHRITCTARGHCGTAPSKQLKDDRLGAAARVAPAALPVARRAGGLLVRRAWIACLGYRRYRYERTHPTRLSPFDAMPVKDAADIANKCLNPYAFLAAP